MNDCDKAKGCHGLQVVADVNGWGDATHVDIEHLLENAASHINGDLREPVVGTIGVRPSPEEDSDPQLLIQYSRPGFACVRLNVRDTCWDQFVYQFVHEFCHVMIDPHRPGGSNGQWLDEAFCEMASVYVLRRMSKRWVTQPPYPNWATYAPSLEAYASRKMESSERQLPAGLSMAAWFSSVDDSLRRDPYQRDRNAVIAYKLLPIFEDSPEAWNSVRCLPVGPSATVDNPTHVHLQSWHDATDPRDKHIVESVMRLLGVPTDGVCVSPAAGTGDVSSTAP